MASAITSSIPNISQQTTIAPFFFTPSSVVINHDGYAFSPVRTFVNKASLLHAIFGDKQKKANRNLFVKKIEERLKEPKIQVALTNVFSNYLPCFSVDRKERDVYYRNARALFCRIFKQKPVSKVDVEACIKETKIENYLERCKRPYYCFTRFDLDLISHVFKTRIFVYSYSDALEYHTGKEYADSMVLVEDLHTPPKGKPYPYYQRCEKKNLLSRAWNVVWDYTASDIQQPMQLFEAFSKYVDADSRKLIFDYAEVPLTDYVNTAMQAVLEKEDWSRTLQSIQNWRFAKSFHRSVTHINCDWGTFDKLKQVVCVSAFPQLHSIRFGSLSASEEYQHIIAQNPNITALFFSNISFEHMFSIATSSAEWVKRIRSLSFNIKAEYETCPSCRLDRQGKLIAEIINRYTHIRYLEFNREVKFRISGNQEEFNHPLISDSELLSYIKSMKGLRKITWLVSENPVVRILDNRVDDGSLKIENGISVSNGNLFSSLGGIEGLRELNLKVKFKSQELRHLQLLSTTLRRLSIRYCTAGISLSHIAQLTLLEELDITGCSFDISEIPLLKSLENLRHLRWGDFITRVTGSGNQSSLRYDKQTVLYKQALREALPNLKELSSKDLHYKYLDWFTV